MEKTFSDSKPASGSMPNARGVSAEEEIFPLIDGGTSLLSHHGDGVWSVHVLRHVLRDFPLPLHVSSDDDDDDEEIEKIKQFHCGGLA